MFRSSQQQPRYFSLSNLGLLAVVLFCLAGRAYSQCSNPANAIVAENCKPGNIQDEWDVSTADAGDPTIQGYASDISVNRGDTAFFKINTDARAYTINIYRMGYYGGLGARKVATISPSATLPQAQPACITDAASGLIDCGNWAVSASWQVPADAVSGIYFAHLIRGDTGGDSHVVFIVRDDSSHSDVLYQTADQSWQAYNFYGGGSLYGPSSANFDVASRSYKVSYNRPFSTRSFDFENATWLFGPEFPMVQWLEQNGYDVTYSTGVDAARNGALIKNHKIYMDSGHDEYWSGEQRTNVTSARDAGVNLAFFSGNEMFWKTRWENSIDGNNSPYKTLVSYKETFAFAKIDPSPFWTGTWRDPSFSPPADGGKPENALTGTLYMVNGPGSDNDASMSIQVPSDDGKMRFWRNTAAATLPANESYTLPTGTLGYEWDEDIDNGARPAGAFHLSTATNDLTTDLLLDYGATYGAGSATHHLMLYRAASGALVFGAGTVNWSWGLNNNHDNPFGFVNPDPDPNMQQATVNLFADMGVQPSSLQSGLVSASASTDTTPPQSAIASPTAGSTLNTGGAILVSGTATDTGGVVAGVEFSGDGGLTWHPATGRGNWTYSWTPTAVGSTTLLSRAVDDTGNLETPHAGSVVNVVPQVCPCTIWPASTVPTGVDSGDATSIEVGVKFRADADGEVIGVRFYKAPSNVGTHVGHLWSSGGALLGTVTFTSEGSSGWQEARFASPIPVTANTTYTVSYFAPMGHYSADASYFSLSGVNDPPLHALANGADGQNGLYFYSSAGGFPAYSYGSTNYWVDVVYSSSNTYDISGTISGVGAAGATVNLSGAASATTTADSSGNYAFNGLTNGAYTVSPSNPGVAFAPSSQTVNINDSSTPGVNFAAVVTNPLSISGNISGGSGASVALSGAASSIVTADSSGNYVFSGLLAGSYTVTPSLADTLFSPSSQRVVLNSFNATGVNFQTQFCNCTSIWPASVIPSAIDGDDATPVEVGVKFRSDNAGYITALRFYKGSANTGTHIGHIWSSTGTLLGTATFTNETDSGWQQVSFSSPIPIAAHTTYVASYFAPSGHYSIDPNYFTTSGVDNAPLHALANGTDGANGVFVNSSDPSFPINSFNSSNYWVDVVYTVPQPRTISGTISGPNVAGTTVTLSGIVNATTTTDAFGNYVFNGVLDGPYSVTPSQTGLIFLPANQNVVVNEADVANVNFAVAQGCPCNSIWKATDLPLNVDSGDPNPVELGLKFRVDSDGYIVGVRFYKSDLNVGVHIANLWSTAGSGSLLASTTFANESASGWQQVTFASPVPVSSDTTYIVSYFAPAGHYSATSAFFADGGVDNPPLHALGNGVDGENGIYNYSPTSTYPASSFNSTNYWVDVIYAPTSTYSISGAIAGPGGAGATVTLGRSEAATGTTIADSLGGYSFKGLANGKYTVTPSNFGFSFAPTSQTVSISGTHQLAVNFVSSALTYSISGTVSGAPGAVVTLTGTAQATTTADDSGNFTFPGVINGSYSISAASPGLIISPATRPLTVSGANVTGINFTSAIQTYSITGTITGPGAAGAAVTLSGASSASTTADSNGAYSFTGLPSGNYIVTPGKIGRIFLPAGLSLTIQGSSITGANFQVPANCPCDTLWQPSALPAVIDARDGNSGEQGLRFRADADGYITGIRFYKAAADTGTHIGHLWSNSGTLLASATFTTESASGWQQVLFDTPVPISAGTTYVATYFSPLGHYSISAGDFSTAGLDTPPLHALENDVDGQNGLAIWSDTPAFPTSGTPGMNYWVDVIYLPAATTGTYSIAGTITGPGAAGAAVTLSGASSASTTADSNGAYSFTGLPSGNYIVTPGKIGRIFLPAGLSLTIQGSSITGANFQVPANCPCDTLWQPSALPAVIDARDGNSGEQGLRFRADADGYITGIRFYKAAANTGTHIGHLWSNSGTLLASATFTTESASGWQQVLFDTPVPISAGTTYVATYFSPLGHYSISAGDFSTAGLDTPPLHALENDVDGQNGLAIWSSTPAFPTSGTPGMNYWVDVIYLPAATTGTYSIAGTITGPGAAGAAVTLSGASSASTTADSNGAYSFTGLPSGNYIVTPGKIGRIFLPAGLSLTIQGSSITGANFQVPANCPCDTLWQPSALPAVIDARDGNSGEQGLRFRADADGYITGIRFYKAAANTGTHIGHLWSNSGTLLASATFTTESASGWQQVLFDTPVPSPRVPPMSLPTSLHSDTTPSLPGISLLPASTRHHCMHSKTTSMGRTGWPSGPALPHSPPPALPA